MKINNLDCPATLRHGILTLDDGTDIDLNEVYAVLAELQCELQYAYTAYTTLNEGPPPCLTDAEKLLKEFS